MNCHKISQRGIWDSSRMVAHSLPLYPAAHLFSGPDEGTDNATKMNRQLSSSPVNHRKPSIPLPKQSCSTANKVSTVFWHCLPSQQLPPWISSLLPPGCCRTQLCHVPTRCLSPATCSDGTWFSKVADKTLLRIRQRAAFCLWKCLWKALCSHTSKYFCPKDCIS